MNATAAGSTQSLEHTIRVAGGLAIALAAILFLAGLVILWRARRRDRPVRARAVGPPQPIVLAPAAEAPGGFLAAEEEPVVVSTPGPPTFVRLIDGLIHYGGPPPAPVPYGYLETGGFSSRRDALQAGDQLGIGRLSARVAASWQRHAARDDVRGCIYNLASQFGWVLACDLELGGAIVPYTLFGANGITALVVTPRFSLPQLKQLERIRADLRALVDFEVLAEALVVVSQPPASPRVWYDEDGRGGWVMDASHLHDWLFSRQHGPGLSLDQLYVLLGARLDDGKPAPRLDPKSPLPAES
jgi:hypothetical protein